jgi:hypothetical protein
VVSFEHTLIDLFANNCLNLFLARIAMGTNLSTTVMSACRLIYGKILSPSILQERQNPGNASFSLAIHSRTSDKAMKA